MTLASRRLVPLGALALAIATLSPRDASACVDSGMPPSEPTQPFDAGPGCTAVLMCGTYYPVCVPDGGQDAGPSMCSEWADTVSEGLDRPPQHYLCSRDEDCPGNRTPAMICGAAGYCECPIELATSACSVGHGGASAAWALAILALAIFVARRA